MFELKQHVVCIDDGMADENWPWKKSPRNYLEISRGTVYTVRWIGSTPDWPDKFDNLDYLEANPHRKLFLKFEEIYRIPVDTAFWAGRFRPLKKLSTDNFNQVSLPIGEIMKEFLENV